MLLTLGFKPRNVLGSFMLEALIIALIGGAIGCLMALPVNGLVTRFAAVMGTVGGFFPALRAARMQVAQAPREG